MTSKDQSKFPYDRSEYVVMPPIRKAEDGTLTTDPQPVDNWEFFTDGAYWDMCAVRPIGDKSFNSPNLFHVSNLKEGERLASLLNIHCTYSPPIGIEAITDIAWDVFFNSDKPAPYNQMKDVILYLAAIGRLKV